MDLFHLEYFCTVALTQSISEAARRHFVSQPAMSKYMSCIEKELQTPLFIRNGNQITLSSDGEKFYAHAKRIIADYKDALMALKEEKARLTINIQVNTTRHVLLHYLETYLAAHPQIDILIDFNSREDALNSNDISSMYHFTIGTKNKYQYQNKSCPLFSERLMLAVPASHPYAGRESISVLELQDESFILQSRTRNYCRRLVQCCESYGFTPKVRLLCNETKYICNTVAAGLGISVVPEFSWSEMLSEKIVLVPIDEMKDNLLTHHLFWNDNRFHPREMLEFREGLIQYYAQYNQTTL